MSYDDVLSVLKGGKGSGNFGHSGRPGKRGGSAGGSGVGGASFDTPVGKVAVSNVILYQTPMQRNRGIEPKAGIVLSTPDSAGFIKISRGSLPDKNATPVDIHISDITEITQR